MTAPISKDLSTHGIPRAREARAAGDAGKAVGVAGNNAGGGGGSRTGCTSAGKGATGGNASSGDSGTAYGGDVVGSGGMMNVDSSEWLHVRDSMLN